MRKIKILALFSVFLVTQIGSAEILVGIGGSLEDTNRFEQKIDFTVEGITTPKVVIFEGNDIYSSFSQTALWSDKLENFISHRIERILKNSENTINFSAFTQEGYVIIELTDKNTKNNIPNIRDSHLGRNYTFSNDQIQKKLIIKNLDPNQNIESLVTHLSAGTIRPSKITIKAQDTSGRWETILDRYDFQVETKFPPLSGIETLEITYESPHLLRLDEIELFSKQNKPQRSYQLIFYAEESVEYTLFIEPHFGQKNIYTDRRQPLRTDEATPIFSLPAPSPNPNFDNDFDDDGLADSVDLCPRVPDPANLDQDSNGRGDVCEDPDQDGKISSEDNCPFNHNRNQSDTDQDGIGDACDNQENRTSEVYKDWLLNIGFGIMALVLLGLLFWTFKSDIKKD